MKSPIFILFLFGQGLMAQSFITIPAGAQWKEDEEFYNGDTMIKMYRLTDRDTFHHGLNLKIVERDIIGLCSQPPPQTLSFFNYMGLFQDTLSGRIICNYFTSPLDSVILMDFNLQPGDTFTLNNGIMGGSLEVDSIVNVFFHGIWRRKWYFKGLVNAGIPARSWFLEGMGYGTGIYHLPFYEGFNLMYARLSSYCENDTLLYVDSAACSFTGDCFTSHILKSQDELTGTTIRFTQNEEQVEIRLPDSWHDTHYRLLSLNGTRIKHGRVEDQSFRLEKKLYPPGFYFIILEKNGNPLYWNRIIIY